MREALGCWHGACAHAEHTESHCSTHLLADDADDRTLDHLGQLQQARVVAGSIRYMPAGITSAQAGC